MKKLIILFFPLFIFSQESESISFNNDGSYISIPNSNSLNPTEAFTISFWLKLNNTNGQSHFFNKWNNGGGDLACDDDPDDCTSQFILKCEPDQDGGIFAAYVSGAGYLASNIQPTIGTWEYLSFTYDSQLCIGKFFINGVMLQEISTDCENLTSTDYPINIGGNSTVDDSNTIDGRMDNIEFWNIALSDDEIQQYRDCHPNGDEEGLVGFWNFNDGPNYGSDGTPEVADQSIYENHGFTFLASGSIYNSDNCPESCIENEEEETGSGLVGDVNCDGDITLFDAQMVVSILLEEWDELGVSNYNELVELYPCSEGVGTESNSEALEEVLEVLEGMNNNSNSNQSNNKTLMYTIDGF